MDFSGFIDAWWQVKMALWLCPSLLVLPLLLWVAWRKPKMGHPKLFGLGVAVHGVGVVLAIGAVWWFQYSVAHCQGCGNRVQLLLTLPIVWFLFVVAVMCNFFGYRPRLQNRHQKRNKVR